MWHDRYDWGPDRTSTPRTGVSEPKHGKEDDQPHVGGNTWAGGTGGSDTAGLGGRGGPYVCFYHHVTIFDVCLSVLVCVRACARID